MRSAIIFAAMGALSLAGAGPSLAQPCSHPGTTQANTELARQFYAAINNHAKDSLDGVLAQDWIDVPLAPGQGPGLAGMKGAMGGYFRAFPDFAVKNQYIIAAGDKIVVRSTITATQAGAFAGVAATDKPITLMAIDIHQIGDGRIAQTWHLEDWLGALFQIGALPPKS